MLDLKLEVGGMDSKKKKKKTLIFLEKEKLTKRIPNIKVHSFLFVC